MKTGDILTIALIFGGLAYLKKQQRAKLMAAQQSAGNSSDDKINDQTFSDNTAEKSPAPQADPFDSAPNDNFQTHTMEY